MGKQALNNGKKHAIVTSIATKQVGAELKMAYGSSKRVSAEFGISEQTVKRVWKSYVDQKRMGVLAPDLSVKFNERGRKSLLTDLMRERVWPEEWCYRKFLTYKSTSSNKTSFHPRELCSAVEPTCSISLCRPCPIHTSICAICASRQAKVSDVEFLL